MATNITRFRRTPIHAFQVTDEATRLGMDLSGNDVGTVVWQTDDDTYWVITSADPKVFSPMTPGGVGGGVTDHGALTGRDDDDHTQYVLEDGSRAFSGDLDMGGNAIVNTSTVDGVDIPTALSGKQSTSEKGQVDGYAELDGSGQVPAGQLPPGGSGDVVGPASATDDALAVFDTTSGKLLKNSTATAGQVASNTAKLTADTANVTAAGALMDSEVDANLQTFALPASTTISPFGAALVDDVDAAAARVTLGVGSGTGDVVGPASATDNALAVFDGTTGELLKDSTATVAQIVANTDKTSNVDHTGDVVTFGAAATIQPNVVTLAKLATKTDTSPGILGYDIDGNPVEIAEGAITHPLVSAAGTGPAFFGQLQASGIAATAVSGLNLATNSAKGLAPVLSNVVTEFLNGTGAYSVPAGGGGSPVSLVIAQLQATGSIPAATAITTGNTTLISGAWPNYDGASFEDNFRVTIVPTADIATAYRVLSSDTSVLNRAYATGNASLGEFALNNISLSTGDQIIVEFGGGTEVTAAVDSFTAGDGTVNSGTSVDPVLDVVSSDAAVVVNANDIALSRTDIDITALGGYLPDEHRTLQEGASNPSGDPGTGTGTLFLNTVSGINFRWNGATWDALDLDPTGATDDHVIKVSSGAFVIGASPGGGGGAAPMQLGVWEAQAGGAPASGFAQLSPSFTKSAIVTLIVADVPKEGANTSDALNTIGAGDFIYLQDKADPGGDAAFYSVTSKTDGGVNVNFGLSHISSVGAADFAATDDLIVGFVRGAALPAVIAPAVENPVLFDPVADTEATISQDFGFADGDSYLVTVSGTASASVAMELQMRMTSTTFVAWKTFGETHIDLAAGVQTNFSFTTKVDFVTADGITFHLRGQIDVGDPQGVTFTHLQKTFVKVA